MIADERPTEDRRLLGPATAVKRRGSKFGRTFVLGSAAHPGRCFSDERRPLMA